MASAIPSRLVALSGLQSYDISLTIGKVSFLFVISLLIPRLVSSHMDNHQCFIQSHRHKERERDESSIACNGYQCTLALESESCL